MNLLQSGSGEKIKRFQLDLTLTPAQQEIEANSRRFTFIRAGRKFGKTKYSEYKALKWLAPKNAVHWHIAPTYKQAKLISWDSFKRMVPQEALYKKPNDNDLTMVLKNNAQLYLMGSDEENSLRGPAPTSVTFEEAAYHKAGVWQNIIRPNLTVHKAPALFISSPNGFNWFKDLEDEARESIDAGENLWAVFHKTIYDNPYIDRDEIDSIKKKCDPHAWSQEYMAEYESSVGRVFHEFQDTDRHVRSFSMPTSGEMCFRATDWGLRDDCGTLWAVLRDKLYIYRENAENGLSPAAQAGMIMARTSPKESVYMSVLSHDAARLDLAQQGLTIEWHFRNAGIRPLKLSTRKKNASRALIIDLLSKDKIVIHPECRMLRKQLLSYSWKDTAMEKTEDGGDDLVDALHYMAELVEHKMFLNRPKEETAEERMRKAQEEMRKVSTHRYPLSSPEKFSVPDFENSPAGYIS